jgi:hypothetical protein
MFQGSNYVIAVRVCVGTGNMVRNDCWHSIANSYFAMGYDSDGLE